MRLVFRNLRVLLICLLPACKTFEYGADDIVIDEGSIHVGNVGFRGYVLKPPNGYRQIQDDELRLKPAEFNWIETFRMGYRTSEGLDYHFHQDFVFHKGDQVIFFIPFQLKNIRQFRHTPHDILAKFKGKI